MVTPFSPLPVVASASAKAAALPAEISKRVSVSPILIEPTSRLPTPPALQIIGSSHLGSARCLRPSDSVNQTPPSMSGWRGSRGPASAGRSPRRGFSDTGASETCATSSGTGRAASCCRRYAAASCSGLTLASSSATKGASVSSGGGAAAAISRIC